MPRFTSRQTRQSFHPGKARRLSEWTSITNSADQVIPANTFSLVGSFTGAILAAIVPATLVRVRGRLLFVSDQAAAQETQIGSIGIAIIKEPVRAAGGAALPDPFVDAAADFWLYWESLNMFGSQGDPDHGGENLNMVIDTKAMRKVEDGDALVVMVANHHATAGFQINWNARFLWLLH